MTYQRTDDIKRKQSESMKKVHARQEYDWNDIKSKREATLKAKGIKPGRKPGNGPLRKGEYKPCPVCTTPVYYKPKQLQENKRKCCSRACMHKDEVYRSKLKNADKSYMQTAEYRATKLKASTPEYRRYRNQVTKLTERNYVNNIDIINPNRYPRTIAGVEGGWQLDHIMTVKECFLSGLSPEVASDTANLRMLPWKENIMRNKKCH